MLKIFLSIFTAFYSTHAVCQVDTLANTISIGYEQIHFDKQFDLDWKTTTLEYKRKTNLGAALGRINYGDRFGRGGLQFELEGYPVLSKKIYSYIGFSYSNDRPVFPKFRTGATLYYSIIPTWEAEAGFRLLYFDKSIWLGNFGVSKYIGSWLFNIKSFFSVNAGSSAYFFTSKKYFTKEKNYAWLLLGSGYSPDEIRNIQINTKEKLSTRRAELGIKFLVSGNIGFQFIGSLSKDEYIVNTIGHQYSGSAAIFFRFTEPPLH
jgi:YaiO family outer membrane protein